MADPWDALRQRVRKTKPGTTFQSSLLNDANLLPQELGLRSAAGGTTLFSDSPETIDTGTLLADGQTLASSVGYNIILFTDTAGLSANTRCRLFLHHRNATGVSRTLHVRVINRGTVPDARLRFGPVFGGQPADIMTAGMAVVSAFLDAIAPDSALPPSDEDLEVSDAVPEVATATITVPFFDGTSATLLTLTTLDFVSNRTLSAMIELMALDAGLHLYVVLGDPPPTGYEDDSQTAALVAHERGTFAGRLVTRIESSYGIRLGTETPGRFRLVTRPAEAQPADTDWFGSDNTLWQATSNQSDVGNYGRMHYVRVVVPNTGSKSLNVALVANPRTPTSAYYGAVRDVDAGATWRVPTIGSVATGDGARGTLLWKSAIAAGGSLTKRLRYTPAGGSAAKLSLWVIPYSGALGSV